MLQEEEEEQLKEAMKISMATYEQEKEKQLEGQA